MLLSGKFVVFPLIYEQDCRCNDQMCCAPSIIFFSHNNMLLLFMPNVVLTRVFLQNVAIIMTVLRFQIIYKKMIWPNTPLYGLNSVPLITMIGQKKFRASYEIHSNHF